MNTKIVLDVFGFQRQYLGMLINDIPAARFTEQPKGAPNHPAWHLGHLSVAMDNLIASLGGEKKLEAWKDKFGMGSVPLADPQAYPSKDELVRTFDERRSRLTSLLAELPAARLQEPNPSEMLRPMLPTREHMLLFFLHFHEGGHLGQIAGWRKAAGMPEALSQFAR